MDQGLISVLSLAASVGISLVALAISLYTFRAQRRESSYSDIDGTYAQILKLAVQTPFLRDRRRTSCYFLLAEDDEYRLQYEAYAFMCWNLLETIFDRQADARAHLGVSNTWLPVIEEENRLHFHWFCRNLRLFKGQFQGFVMSKLNSLSVQMGGSADLDQIYPRLMRDFPPDELKSRGQFERLMSKGQYKLYLAKHATLGVIGYALMYEPKSPKIAWLDYIAIDEQYRNAGFGTAFFTRLCEMLKGDRMGMMLEVEPPTSDDEAKMAIEQRRIRFYQRAGAKQLDVEYLFPSEDGPYPLLLFFRPISHVDVLSATQIREMIRSAYEYIHDDVRDREAILQRFLGKVRDNRL